MLPARIDARLGGRDLSTIAVLAIHSLAALGRITGVVAMVAALSATALIGTGGRARLATAYLRWGAIVHFALVPVVVATGIYNLFYPTPFELVWDWGRLDAIPYGRLYMTILVGKLALFALLLVPATLTLRRTLAVDRHQPQPRVGGARRLWARLGVPGMLYIAAIPLIVAFAVALRYVHVLAHGAETVVP